MSTRKIREMQEWVAAHAGDIGNEWLAALAEEALDEVEAIQRAAREWVDDEPSVASHEVLEAIAQESAQ